MENRERKVGWKREEKEREERRRVGNGERGKKEKERGAGEKMKGRRGEVGAFKGTPATQKASQKSSGDKNKEVGGRGQSLNFVS